MPFDGARIKDLRLKEGLILKEFAEYVYSTPTMVNQIENGIKLPGIELAKRIANYYGLTADELIIGSGQPDANE